MTASAIEWLEEEDGSSYYGRRAPSVSCPREIVQVIDDVTRYENWHDNNVCWCQDPYAAEGWEDCSRWTPAKGPGLRFTADGVTGGRP